MTRRQEMLDAIRQDEEQLIVEGEGRPAEMVRRRPAKQPAQVYSLRIPTDRLDQLRRLANERGIEPSALMRQWVIAQLDAEASGATVDLTADNAAGSGMFAEAVAGRILEQMTDDFSETVAERVAEIMKSKKSKRATTGRYSVAPSGAKTKSGKSASARATGRR